MLSVGVAAPRIGQDRRFVRLDLGVGAVDQLGGDAQILASAGWIVQLGDERLDERRGEHADVGRAVGAVAVEEGVAGGVDPASVLGHDRPQQALAVAEVVLQRGRVALMGLAIDLPERDPVDAPRRRTAARRP